jgi:hypothetical protein
MLKKIFGVILLLSFLVFPSCQNDITIPKPCVDEPNFPFTTLSLQIVTEITSNNTIYVDKKGYIICDNIMVQGNGIKRNIKIGGYICASGNFYVPITFNDTVDNSRIKVEGTLAHNYIDGTVYYCPNIDNNCQFERVGSVSASYSGCQGMGSFTMMQFSGGFSYICREQ